MPSFNFDIIKSNQTRKLFDEFSIVSKVNISAKANYQFNSNSIIEFLTIGCPTKID